MHHVPARGGVGAENLIRRTDQGRCTRKNVATCRGTYVPHSVAPAVRQDPDGDLEILVSNPIGVFGTHTICRRCGARTDSPVGSKHVPGEHLLARSDEWLAAQARTSRIERTIDIFRT